MLKNYVILFVILIFCGCNSNKNSTIRGLRISDNRRFFMDDSGKPFFWLGDTGWLLFTKLDRENGEKYLEDRKEKGFDIIQAILIHDQKHAVNVYGDSALINKNVATPCTTIGNSFDDPRQYDYWDHVDYLIDLAATKGIYMALVPVWGSNVKKGMVSIPQAKAYAEWLAERYKSKPNIIWINGGDIPGSDTIDVWNAIGYTFWEKDPTHLVTYHPTGRSTSSKWYHNELWLDFNMCQSGHRRYDQDDSELHYGEDNWRYIKADYALTPVKPVLDGEPSYEDIPQGLHDTLQPYWTDKDVRRYAYWSVFAGACGFTYGNNAIMQFYRPGDTVKSYGVKKFWFDALNAPGACQMIYLKQLMLSFPYFERIPDQSLVDEQGERYDYQAATRGNDYALIYTYNGRNITVAMGKISGEKVRASWYNPKDGNRTKIGTFKNIGNQVFDPPGDIVDGNDWVLILERS